MTLRNPPRGLEDIHDMRIHASATSNLHHPPSSEADSMARERKRTVRGRELRQTATLAIVHKPVLYYT